MPGEDNLQSALNAGSQENVSEQQGTNVSTEIANSSQIIGVSTSPKSPEVDNDQQKVANNGMKISESPDESLFESVNTLDDISSLETVEEDPNFRAGEEERENNTSNDMKISANSLKEDSMEKDDTVTSEMTNENEEEEEGDEIVGEWVDVIGSGDLMKKVIQKGKGIGTRPVRGNLIKVKLIESLENGDVIKSKEKSIIVGDSEVVQGLDLIFPLMELNEICEVTIKPRLAYGHIGKSPNIPSDSTMNYNIELLSVEDDPDPEKMSIAERKLIGDTKRNHGNFWYGRGEYSCALQCYRRSLDFLDDSSANFSETSSEQQELAALWMKVSNNMAAAQLKIGAYDAALKSVENVLKVQPKNLKALFRKGKILVGNGNTEEAVKVFKTLIEMEPDNKMFQQELYSAASKVKLEKQSERDMYRRMLGQDKKNSTAAMATKTNDSSNQFLKWGLIVGGVTAALASLVVYRHFHVNTSY